MSLPEPADDLAAPPAPPAVAVLRGERLSTPVVFASPHSGRFYPPSMMAQARLGRRDMRALEDPWVDELVTPAHAAGVSVITAGYARAYVDLNRSVAELDAAMFDGEAEVEEVANRSARLAAGFGCIPRVAATGREIYGRKLPASEAPRRLEAAWRPYHQTLEALLDEAREGFGRAVLIDWHSMPSAAQDSGRSRGRRTADVVLGDRFGSACSGLLTARVERALQAMGYRVTRNAPYAGGWTTERYGRPAEGLHALQVELNRRLYVNEESLERTAGFWRLRRDTVRVAAEVAGLAATL